MRPGSHNRFRATKRLLWRSCATVNGSKFRPVSADELHDVLVAVGNRKGTGHVDAECCETCCGTGQTRVTDREEDQSIGSLIVRVSFAGRWRDPPSWVGAICLLIRRFLGQSPRQALHGET